MLYLFEISIHNAHILYNLRGNKMSLYDFHLAIVKGLCKVDDVSSSSEDSESYPNPVLRSPVHDPPLRLLGGHKKHHLELIPGTNKTPNPQKRCRICYRADIRKDTRYRCKECNVPLDVERCFALYHSNATV